MKKPKSVIAALTDELRRDISLGVIKPGDKLNIESLKRDHSVSHPSVREALSMLVGEGYVCFEESKGFRVQQLSKAAMQDTIRVRAELEALAFEWAVSRSNLDWRSKIVAAHYALSEVEDQMIKDSHNTVLEWDARNREFHMMISANCGSQKLIDLIEQQYDQSRRFRLMAHADSRSETSRMRWVRKSGEEHKALKDAVLAGDVKAGRDILRKHITKAPLHAVSGAADDSQDIQSNQEIQSRA
ncbi:FCD domain-containing protein [Cognatishimia sp. SS12]|uniref:GntR family transcriptional regulator n=1 Tax=Cognatishimia sp. SS12 TaxID=2979465 RepID=UPI00232B83F8|nr:FCD domain-containing protein [Cognatishimia sp. SS12]MDC0738045.1 FCD domain-containing protein [Cognatishimia sp. SS12]